MGEINQMQEHINQIEVDKSFYQKVVNKVRENFEHHISIVHQNLVEDSGDPEKDKKSVKANIDNFLKQIAVVDNDKNMVNSKAIELNLMATQLVHEISKLYEKQIVLEKQKSTNEIKKLKDKYKNVDDSKKVQNLESQLKQLQTELSKYKIYLPEAEDLLKEVNGRHE